MTVAAIVPAAGASVRMGRPKLLIEFDGLPLIAKVVAALVEAWVTAERPHSADLQLTAFPHEQSTSAAAGGRVVGLASATLLVEYPRARVG